MSEKQIQDAAEEVIIILKTFDSPKDAVLVLISAHYKMIVEAFPPEMKMNALKSIDIYAKLLKEELAPGWR